MEVDWSETIRLIINRLFWRGPNLGYNGGVGKTSVSWCFVGGGGWDHDCPQSRPVAGTVTVLSQLLAPGADSWISPGGHQLDTVYHCDHTIAVLTISFVVLKSKAFEIGWGFTSVFWSFSFTYTSSLFVLSFLVLLAFTIRGFCWKDLNVQC